MNRGHDADAYLRLIERVRAARPDIALSGDFIVGFPGEREADFEATLALVRAVRYASAFSFKYSRRPGTPGAAMPGQVAEAEKDARLARLQALLNEQQRGVQRRPGRARRCRCCSRARAGIPGQIVGRSPYLQAVHCQGRREPGREHRAGATSAPRCANSLAGEQVLETA